MQLPAKMCFDDKCDSGDRHLPKGNRVCSQTFCTIRVDDNRLVVYAEHNCHGCDGFMQVWVNPVQNCNELCRRICTLWH